MKQFSKLLLFCILVFPRSAACLSHELGHLAKNSRREEDAEKAARELRKRLKEAGEKSLPAEPPAPQAAASNGDLESSLHNKLKPIMIAVYDYAHSKPSVLLEAERTAAAILAKAGLEAAWLACLTDDGSPGPSACASPNLTHLTLRVVPASTAKLWPLFNNGAFAYTPLGEQFNRDTWVLYDRVKDFAGQKGLTFDRLLGAVIAHELGHLLLGENLHAVAGLMHGRWSRQELLAIESASLFFSDDEGKRIQSAVIARREEPP